MNLTIEQKEEVLELIDSEGFKILCGVILKDVKDRYKEKVVCSHAAEVMDNLNKYKGVNEVISIIEGLKSNLK
jgi:uncharacterized protein YrzB (UPF0473 family)